MNTSTNPAHPVIGYVHEVEGIEQPSDLTIVCGDVTYNVHTAVMCSKSDWFRAACTPYRLQEGETAHIQIRAKDSSVSDGDYPAHIKAIIDFLYGTAGWADVEPKSQRLQYLVGLFVTADKYLLPKMMEGIVRQFSGDLSAITSPTPNEDIPKLFDLVYSECPPEGPRSVGSLRYTLVYWVVMDRDDLLNAPGISAVVEKHHDLARDLFYRMRHELCMRYGEYRHALKLNREIEQLIARGDMEIRGRSSRGER
ncbi:hypothetical protein B9Z65_743 [Elsinoe australis]|uniref:BTB domain-containing protein n=1 Tax=Elsinoe australis TaxID=40998 RepID=A0A2P8AJD7_9PEZI|nr:hypothetical protein B9Z65_743 [Elsinoe australis]